MKDLIINYLEGPIRDRLKRERDDYRKKIGEGKINNKLKFLDKKLDSNLTFTEIIKYKVIFDDMPMNVVDYLSPYGTFFNGYTFFYDPEKLNNLNDDQKAQAICCEICNFLTRYYVLNTTLTISNTSVNIRLGKVLGMMYCIGLFLERPKFTQDEQRRYVLRDFKVKYPKADVLIFAPNMNATIYLYNQMNFENSPHLYNKRKQTFTPDVMINDFEIMEWNSEDGNALCSSLAKLNSFKFIKDKNGIYKRTTGRSKMFAENEEHIEVAKKLAGDQW